jgi:hypothetical protein
MAKKTRTILAHAVTRRLSIARFTWTACHSPPRGVRSPRAFKASAIPFSVRTPAALIWSTTGRMLSAAGESWAFKEIGDRLEGKPMQPIEHSDADDRTSIEEFTDAELSATCAVTVVLEFA